MKKNISLLIIFFIIISIYPLSSQMNDLGSIIPPSPEASSLAKFTEIPVSYYTGLPQISVPLYSFLMEDLEINIALRYHARGVAVGEISSRTGMGWGLQAGGAIVRQVRGKPDDKSYGYLQSDFYETFFNDPNTRQNVYNSLLNDEIDLEPDRFSFNFLDYSGKFYFDQKTKKIVMENYSDMKIEPIFENNYYNILGWILTLPNGYKFYFGMSQNLNPTNRAARDTDLIQDYKATIGNYITLPFDELSSCYNAWHLIDIVSPTGKIVSFGYEKDSIVYYRKNYDTLEKNNLGNQELVSYFSKVSSLQYQLQSILFDKGTVSFFSSPITRKDLSSSHALEFIEVKDLYKNKIKKLHLHYSYSQSTSTNDVLPTLLTFDPESAYRLFLDSIVDITGGEKIPPYVFTYTNKNKVPNRFSTSQDYWGFYNGENNGYFLNFSNVGEDADNKMVEPDKAKIGLLSKITLPTGGYIIYDFEPNISMPPSYFDQLIFNNVNPTQSKSFGFFKNHESQVSSGVYESNEFFIGKQGSTYINTFFNIYGNKNFHAQIVNKNGSVIQNIPKGSNKIISNLENSEFYKIRVTSTGNDDPYDLNESFSVLIRWEEYENGGEIIYSGGNRINRITTYDGYGGKIEKQYEYNMDNNVSSGRVHSLPCYNFIYSVTADGVEHLGILRPGTPLSYNQGNHIGYSCVTEYLKENNFIEGKTKFYYTNMHDDGTFWTWPYVIPDDNEDYRGKITRIDYYKYNKDLAIFNIIRRTNYQYIAGNDKLFSFNNSNEYPSTYSDYKINKTSFCIPLIVFSACTDDKVYNSYTTYYVRGGTMQLSRIDNIDYDPELIQDYSNITINSSESYKYDNINHYQIKQQITNNSKGDIITKKYYYPSDYNHYFNTLKDKNIITPVDIRVYNGNYLTDGIQYNFNEKGQPIEIYKAEVNQNINEIPFDASKPFTFNINLRLFYNDFNKLKQITRYDNTKTSFLWDKLGVYMMAKVENAAYSSISVLDGKEWGYSSSSLHNEIESIIPKSLSTTYSYKPLIGLLSTTLSNGITTYYQYDSVGRLKSVKDHAGKIINQYDYHYKR